MHSTTNNPNLRKKFCRQFVKKIIFMTPYWKQTVPMSGMSYTSTPPPPKQLLQHHSICIQWQCGALLSKMCSVFSESKPRPLANISRSTHV